MGCELHSQGKAIIKFYKIVGFLDIEISRFQFNGTTTYKQFLGTAGGCSTSVTLEAGAVANHRKLSALRTHVTFVTF